MSIDALTARFRILHRQFNTPSRDPHARRMFNIAQRELWQLAQAITALTNLPMQLELDAARRDVIAQIQLHIEQAGPVAMRPTRVTRPPRWYDFELTPELSIDPTVTGASVLPESARRLRIAHRAQVKYVSNIALTRC